MARIRVTFRYVTHVIPREREVAPFLINTDHFKAASRASDHLVVHPFAFVVRPFRAY